MVFNCSICSESLEKGPGENPADPFVVVARNAPKSILAALPCGHIFHSFCINKWMAGEMATSSKCPCCRKTIGTNKCIPIFPDSYDESLREDRDDDFPVPVGNANANAQMFIPCNHNAEINTLQTQSRALERELEQMNRLYELQGEDFQELNNKFQQERLMAQNYALKYKQFESYKDLYDKCLQKVKQLEEANKKYVHIESALQGVKFETKEDVKNFRVDEKSIRTLVEIKHMLQNELDSSKRSVEEKQRDHKRMASKLRSAEFKVKKLEHEKVELESVITSLREEVDSSRSANATPSPGPSSSLSRSRGPKPSSFRFRKADDEKLNSTINLTTSSDEDVDEDVGVLKPFAFKLPSERKRAFSPTGTATKSQSKSKLRRSESQPSLVSSKGVSSKASRPEKNSCSILSGRSNVPGVAPITPIVRHTAPQLKISTKTKKN